MEEKKEEEEEEEEKEEKEEEEKEATDKWMIFIPEKSTCFEMQIGREEGGKVCFSPEKKWISSIHHFSCQ